MISHSRRSLTTILMLLGLLLLACSPQGARQSGEVSGAEAASAERQYAQILDAYRQGRVEEARALSVDLLDAYPGFHAAPSVRLRLAESYLEEADRIKANPPKTVLRFTLHPWTVLSDFPPLSEGR